MTESCVDLLKLIGVEEYKRQWLPQPLGSADVACSHLVQRAPIVDLRQGICERLEAGQFVLQGRRNNSFTGAAQLEPTADNVGVEQNEQSDQANEELPRYGDLHVDVSLSQNGGGQDKGDQTRSDEDPCPRDNHPEFPISLFDG